MITLNLKKLLLAKGKSKYWLVKGLESNYTVVNNMLENKTTGINFETIDKLCKLFDCMPGDLFLYK